MEMKKTAMQELLHNLKNMGETIPSETPDTTLMAIVLAIGATYLEKEKRQLIKSFDAGEFNYKCGVKDDNNFEYEGGEDWFKKYYETPNDLI